MSGYPLSTHAHTSELNKVYDKRPGRLDNMACSTTLWSVLNAARKYYDEQIHCAWDACPVQGTYPQHSQKELYSTVKTPFTSATSEWLIDWQTAISYRL